MRDRLIELISRVQYMGGLEGKLADYLLKNGVIVPPCKVGDFIEYDTGASVTYHEVKGFVYNPEDNGIRFILDICTPTIKCPAVKRILTHEEAEKALERSENGK